MLRRTFILISLIFFQLSLFGQVNRYGYSPIVNYPPEVTSGSEQNWAIVQDGRGVIYVGNDENGVLEYDGSEWRVIPVYKIVVSGSRTDTITPHVRSLGCADDGTIFVGAVSEFGYLASDINGSLHYKSLVPRVDTSERDGFTNVWKTYCAGEKVYFHSEEKVMIYSRDQDTVKVANLQRNALFGFYENDTYYFGDFTTGLMYLQGDSVSLLVNGGDFFKQKDIYGLASYDDESLLISTSQDGINLLNTTTGRVISPFGNTATNTYLKQNFLTHLGKMHNGDFIASTINGGVAHIDREGNLVAVISKEQGLQDQTIYSSYLSSTQYPYTHIWTAMSIGVGRISFESPFHKITQSAGYQGLIHSINSIGNRIFLGTNSGLYMSVFEQNQLRFKKLPEFTRNVWDLVSYTLTKGEKILLAAGVDGIMEVHEDGSVYNLKDRISGDFAVQDMILAAFKLSVDPFRPEYFLMGAENTFSIISYKNGRWRYEATDGGLNEEIRSVGVSKQGNYWYATKQSGLRRVEISNDTLITEYYTTANGLPNNADNAIFQLEDDILIGTKEGVYTLIESSDTTYFEPDSLLNSYLPPGRNYIHQLHKDEDKGIWISYQDIRKDWHIILLQLTEDGSYRKIEKPFLNLDNFSTDIFYSDADGIVWFSKSDVLYNYNKSKSLNEGGFSTLIRRVVVDDEDIIYDGAYPLQQEDGSFVLGSRQDEDLIPSIKYSRNNIEFRWSAPFFVNEEQIEYSYKLEGFSDDWSSWENVLYQDFTNIPQGDYTFRIRARNVFGDIGEEDRFEFIILPPWYLTIVAFLGYIILAVFIIYIIIVLYTRRLKNENIRLEGIIQDRTAEIRKQKEELTDSIEYASRIQRALLPPENLLIQNGLDYFIMFRPRDIVSGDFYWFGSSDEKLFIVAADCTGHGVPGAFMSMLGISFLDEIVIKSGIHDTNKILDALRNHVITSLKQTGKSMDESTKDGMDLSMVAIDTTSKTVQYSGAYNPLYVVRPLTSSEKQKIKDNGELELERGSLHSDTHLLYQVKADHMPIGISEKDHNFSVKDIKDKDATLYLFSDGYVDQFGGPSGKKFMSKNFKKLLLEIQHLSMVNQRKKLESTLDDWMGEISQIDDILVLGIRV